MIYQSQQTLLSLESYESFIELSPKLLTRSQWAAKRRIVSGNFANRWLAFAIASRVVEYEQANGRSPAAVETELLGMLKGKVKLPGHGVAARPANWKVALRRHSRAGDGDAPLHAWIAAQPPVRDFFNRQGLRFPVGNFGLGLSGGQKQLIALTRVLRRGTPLVILDEPTSALDPQSKERVARCLREFAAHRVVLVVTHDDIVIRHADQILTLRDGRVVPAAELALSL